MYDDDAHFQRGMGVFSGIAVSAIIIDLRLEVIHRSSLAILYSGF